MKKAIEIDVAVTSEELAAEFCELTDQQQAQVLIDVAAICALENVSMDPNYQWRSVGLVLRDCGDYAMAAREMVLAMAAAIQEERKAAC